MKRLKTAILLTAGALLIFSAVPVLAQESGAENETQAQTQGGGIWGPCSGSAASGSAICADAGKTEATSIVKNIINLFLYAIGILSVILIIHSGLKYVNSRGDAEAIKSAKNTLLYAVIGLIVAMMAFTIVNFVIGAFGNSTGTGTDTEDLRNNQQEGINE